MSVLSCDRRGCKNIMCDRYSHTYGYICNECFRELVERKTLDYAAFMNSEKEYGRELPIQFEQIAEMEFPYQ